MCHMNSWWTDLRIFCWLVQNAQEKRTYTRQVHFGSPEPISAEGDASQSSSADQVLPSIGLREYFHRRTIPAPAVSHGLSYDYVDETSQSVGLPSAPRNPPPLQHVHEKPAQSLDLNELPSPLAEEDSRSSEYSLSSEGGPVPEIRSNYKFASIGRQAYLRQRMVERQRIQVDFPSILFQIFIKLELLGEKAGNQLILLQKNDHSNPRMNSSCHRFYGAALRPE